MSALITGEIITEAFQLGERPYHQPQQLAFTSSSSKKCRASLERAAESPLKVLMAGPEQVEQVKLVEEVGAVENENVLGDEEFDDTENYEFDDVGDEHFDTENFMFEDVEEDGYGSDRTKTPRYSI